MTSPQHRSLRHEYELFVEREIEAYKESVPRSVLLGIGDEAVAMLAAGSQLALTELLLCDQVDSIIRKRLRIPVYAAWCRRRLRRLTAYRTPAHWGFEANAPIVRTLDGLSSNAGGWNGGASGTAAGDARHNGNGTSDGRNGPSANGRNGANDARVLVTGVPTEGAALYLAAHGCEVTTVDANDDAVERVMSAAYDAGIAGRVHGYVAGIASYAPDGPLTAVVCTAAAFAGLTPSERADAISTLQSATLDGGVHLVQVIVAGHAGVTMEELAERYRGWTVSVEGAETGQTLIARKLVA